jgi:DNA-binding winged helix-turn-helix (wHTH) protein
MTNNNSFNHTCFNCAELHLDLELGMVKNAVGDTQRLSPINLKLLTHLLVHKGDVVSRTELFDAVWPNQIVNDDVLTRAMSDIRTQLAKLDAATKFIETLPKRGYRWVADVYPVQELDADTRKPEAHVSDVAIVAALPRMGFLAALFIYLSLALLLAAVIMWALTQSLGTQTLSVALLPALADRPSNESAAKALDDALLQVLRKNTKVQLLSKSAIASRPQNPFPYFFNEFGAKWVIEARVNNLSGIENVELSLVDARTGIELRNINFDVNNNAEIVVKVAQKLESDLLVEPIVY